MENISVVHKHGKELINLYCNSQIASLFVKPTEYWKFAMPVKLFEYMTYGKPIIAVKGTAAGDFVEKKNVGWSIEYSRTQLSDLLNRLVENKMEIIEKMDNIVKILGDNTWNARAKQVTSEMLNIKLSKKI